MTPNTRVTIINVPSDSVMVVTTICLPERFICDQMSSVPIIRPTTDSSRLSAVVNQAASSTELSSTPNACGPSAMPVMSQPSMAGRCSFATRRPTRYAAPAVRSSLRIPSTISMCEQSLE